MALKSMAKKAVKRTAIAVGLEAARLLHAAGLMRSARGRGAIFTLHHVRPFQHRAFAPNRHLEITPDFLDTALTRLRRDGYRFIALRDLPGHLASSDMAPVAVFTLDDGYRNNLEHAAPVFARHQAPFTVFVAGGFVDRTATLWWETLAELLQKASTISFDFGQGPQMLATGTMAGKQAAFERIAAFIHHADEKTAVAQLNAVATANGIDALAITQTLTLDDAGLATLASSPFADLGAHTISHRALARLSDDAARDEMEQSAARLQRITGQRPSTIAYPYGDTAAVSPRDHRLARDLGFTAAVTTQPGVLAADTIMQALPRISLNGHFQKAGHVTALASGIPFRLMSRG